MLRKKRKLLIQESLLSGYLKRVKVAVVPGVAFGPNGEGHIRLSFGRKEEDILEVFNRLEKLFL